jgi:hypothetical protein
MFWTKVIEKIKTYILFNNVFFFRKSFRLRNNVEKYCTAGQATDDNIIWRMCIACWVPKATDTHSEYVILIAFPRQQWLRERSSLLRLRTLPALLLSICTPCVGNSVSCLVRVFGTCRHRTNTDHRVGNSATHMLLLINKVCSFQSQLLTHRTRHEGLCVDKYPRECTFM